MGIGWPWPVPGGAARTSEPCVAGDRAALPDRDADHHSHRHQPGIRTRAPAPGSSISSRACREPTNPTVSPPTRGGRTRTVCSAVASIGAVHSRRAHPAQPDRSTPSRADRSAFPKANRSRVPPTSNRLGIGSASAAGMAPCMRAPAENPCQHPVHRHETVHRPPSDTTACSAAAAAAAIRPL